MFSQEEIVKIIRPVISDQLQQFPAFMQLSIAKYIKNQGATGGATSRAPIFNSGNNLFSVSGGLFQSFIKGTKTISIVHQQREVNLLWNTGAKLHMQNS